MTIEDLVKKIDRYIDALKDPDGFTPLSKIGILLEETDKNMLRDQGFNKLLHFFESDSDKYEIKKLIPINGPALPVVRIISAPELAHNPQEKSYFDKRIEYYYDKLESKYLYSNRLGRMYYEPISKILHRIDELPRKNIAITFLQSYLTIKIIDSTEDISLCTFDFNNLEPRVFFNIPIQDFALNFDEARKAKIGMHQTLRGGERPYYYFDRLLERRPMNEKIDYLTDIILRSYDYFMNRD